MTRRARSLSRYSAPREGSANDHTFVRAQHRPSPEPAVRAMRVRRNEYVSESVCETELDIVRAQIEQNGEPPIAIGAYEADHFRPGVERAVIANVKRRFRTPKHE